MKNSALLLLLAAFAVPSIAQSQRQSSQTGGSIEANNTYVNHALGIRVALPGKWHLMAPAKYAQNAPNAQPSADSQCRGPFCKPVIDEALETDYQTLFVTGYKLPPEYLDREHYPLKKFAEGMMQGSLAGSDWVPVGAMSQARIAGHEAYRLLVGNPSKPGKKGFGFVFETNGYMCLLS